MTKVLTPEPKKEERKKVTIDEETLLDLNDKELILNVEKGREEYKKGLTKAYRFQNK